jgi:hypothetical protein
MLNASLRRSPEILPAWVVASEVWFGVSIGATPKPLSWAARPNAGRNTAVKTTMTFETDFAILWERVTATSRRVEAGQFTSILLLYQRQIQEQNRG